MSIKRDQIISAVITRLKSITVAGGYYNGFATVSGQDHVFEDRQTEYTDKDYPALNVVDNSQQLVKDQSSQFGVHVFDLNITVIGVIKSGSTTRQKLRKILADVNKAFKTDLTFSGLVMSVTHEGDEFGTETKEKMIGFLKIDYTLRYSVDAFSESLT